VIIIQDEWIIDSKFSTLDINLIELESNKSYQNQSFSFFNELIQC
jgi:hypothetical protein